MAGPLQRKTGAAGVNLVSSFSGRQHHQDVLACTGVHCCFLWLSFTRPQFLAAHGWRRALTTTRTRMARALGLNPALCGFKLEADKGSLFFVAGVAPQAAGQQPAGQVGKQE